MSKEWPPSHPNISPEFIKKEGWLEKQSRHLKLWRKRWVVITQNHHVFTFQDKGVYEYPTECFRITPHTSTGNAEDETGKPYSFIVSCNLPYGAQSSNISETQYTFFFNAESNEVRQEWREIIADFRASARSI